VEFSYQKLFGRIIVTGIIKLEEDKVKKEKAFLSLTAGLSSIMLIFVLLISSIEWTAFDLNFYKKEYIKLNRAESIGISMEELMRGTSELLDYLKGEREDLKIKATINGEQRYLFNQKEMEHMVDVKHLYQWAAGFRTWSLAAFLLLMVILIFLARKNIINILSRTFEKSMAFFLLLLILLGLFICVDFTAFWDRFHHIFFTNDLWQLNPETDLLIQMVPEQFFFDMVIRILLIFLAGLIFTVIALRAARFALFKIGKESRH
jgi:integral membrane protein (TIGR01906 family)